MSPITTFPVTTFPLISVSPPKDIILYAYSYIMCVSRQKVAKLLNRIKRKIISIIKTKASLKK